MGGATVCPLELKDQVGIPGFTCAYDFAGPVVPQSYLLSLHPLVPSSRLVFHVHLSFLPLSAFVSALPYLIALLFPRAHVSLSSVLPGHSPLVYCVIALAEYECLGLSVLCVTFQCWGKACEAFSQYSIAVLQTEISVICSHSLCS